MPILDRFRLDGKRALITGGSRGLGRAMAQALAEAGADLVLVGREESTLRQAQQELAATGRKADILVADLFQPRAVEAMCGQALALGKVDILINNVGGRRENIPFLEQKLEDWQRLIDLNLTATYVCTRLLGKPMLERGWGRVINIGSICGQIVTRNIEGRHYETAKAAIVGFTRSLGADWAPRGVTVNAIAPGSFLTDANKRWFRERPELRDQIETMIPMKRMGDPEEIGALALYLASEASSYMTGAVVTIDGGVTLW
jgi:NAD(P)-dependent dehydrogenase (short-subunit alcohol dehydrogenase family)